MALKVTKAEMWSVGIDDQAGGALRKIDPVAKAGANFEFVFARRTPEQPGRGLLFVAPVKGAKVVKAATAAGFEKPGDIQGLRIEGPDKPGMGAKIMRALANAGISFRAVSASAIGRKFISYVALDNAADVARATAVLKKLG
jgi:hypothetical protein